MSVTQSREREGGLIRLVLDRPKGNVLDAEMVAGLRAAVTGLAGERKVKLLVFEGRGSHFSFGASVSEHLPHQVGDMLHDFHGLFRDIEALGVPTAALVRGQCLGGGCELAMWCGRVFASPDARLGLPEVTLGVFPPLGALALPWRVGGARATTLVLTGAALPAVDARAQGLVDEVSSNPEAAMLTWYDAHFAPRSAVALRYAWRAARRPLAHALAHELPHLEALYLEGLMSHRDPVEGLNAFLERRAPEWRHA